MGGLLAGAILVCAGYSKTAEFNQRVAGFVGGCTCGVNTPYYAGESIAITYEWSIGTLVNYAATCSGGPGGLPDNGTGDGAPIDPAAAAILDRQTKPCAGCGG